ncbi:hypothetical protein PAXINDRAFT_181390 [Paxillus involutus ATCC 200175]|uniref:PRP1 splicing factor N-terminal domain-containing protein n=1 Tax=Paxillus involutus ATCC 200175 TaxID=664439 RepID=A0A0C9SUY7_PAXIN|nr:hypothetical protein PAXINDRAFT_181390 [Paxillus involutus ATCC 200175]
MAAKQNKLAFLSMPAPASYVAGLGRGASGFTTRSDIGPAREGPSAEAVAEAQARRGEEPEVDPEQFQDPDNEYGLFAGTTYEQDDEEADKIYDAVDQSMDSRRRARREARENEELVQHRAERPKIQQQFADLKRGLSVVTDQEWESIPEVGNLTRKKRRKNERTFVVPDSVIVGDRGKTEYENSLDTRQQQESTLWVLASKLEELDGKSIKARAILEKGRLVNPANEILWAESVGVEERSGGAAQAKAVLSRGLQECATSGLLWSMAIWAEPRPARKSRSVDALKKSKDNAIVTCTVARLFWAERKIEKARQWFSRSVATEQDRVLGDHWAWWLKFERQHGTPEHVAEVVKQCIAAEPHRGPVWQSIAKDDKNVGKGMRDILELVAEALH